MRRTALVLIALAVTFAGCRGDDAAEDLPESIVLMTHDSFAVSDDTLAAFTESTGVSVEILEAGDAGTMVNQAILLRDNPVGDVMFGIDNTLLSRGLDADLFVPYASPLLDDVTSGLRLDPENRVTPIDFGDVCLNYDKDAGITPPSSLADLTDPAYRGRLVVEDPGTSSPGLAFLLATIATFPDEAAYTWEDFWADLRANDVLVTSGWEEAYYGVFSGGSGAGDRPLVVSYASSPPAEVIFSETPLAEAPTGVIPAGCFRQIEFAGILVNSGVGRAGELLIDFMLSDTFQEDIPLNMFVFPAVGDTPLPPEFREHTLVPDESIVLDPDLIEANRERWIERWAEIVLR